MDSSDRQRIAVVGDDLMSDSIAVKKADGSRGAEHDASARTKSKVKWPSCASFPSCRRHLAALVTPAAADPRARVVLAQLVDAGTGVGLDDSTPVSPIRGTPAPRSARSADRARCTPPRLGEQPAELRSDRDSRHLRAAHVQRHRRGPGVRRAGNTCSRVRRVDDAAEPLVPDRAGEQLGREDFFPVQTAGTIPPYDVAAIFNINLGDLAASRECRSITGSTETGAEPGRPGRHRAARVRPRPRRHADGRHRPHGNPCQSELGPFLGGFPTTTTATSSTHAIGKTWPAMTVAERRLSIPNGRNVVSIGSKVTAAVPSRLAFGLPLLGISAPAAIAGQYDVGAATFGGALTSPGVSAGHRPRD